jgi:Xaa-Pro aminopeptidase
MRTLHQSIIRKLAVQALFLVFGAAIFLPASDISDVGDSKNILPLRERAKVTDEWLKWRLENILPGLMRREGIDMWLVICREYNEDPVYLTLVPEAHMSARRTSILMFYDQGPEKGVARLSGSHFTPGDLYEPTWKDKKETQFDSLARAIKSRNPKKIGIDISDYWAFGDGLTSVLRARLEKALGPEYSARLVSAEGLCLGWLETRSPGEKSVYRTICGIGHDIIAEFFSNRVIVPDVTTVDDVNWWIRQKISDLGLQTWFNPGISLQRKGLRTRRLAGDERIIRRGDVLHCDVGVRYLGLCTDMQLQAYVCRVGEEGAPAGLKEALRRANRMADVFLGEFKTGRTGAEIARAAMKNGAAEGLKPLVYSHAIGFHGHGAGCTADAREPGEEPDENPQHGLYPLYPNTAYSMEFSATTKVPEWDNQEVVIGYEEDAFFDGESCRFIDGRQTDFYLIK